MTMKKIISLALAAVLLCGSLLALASCGEAKPVVKVIDIALECGFNNIAYFNRLFSKVYGTSPSEYRSTNRA